MSAARQTTQPASYFLAFQFVQPSWARFLNVHAKGNISIIVGWVRTKSYGMAVFVTARGYLCCSVIGAMKAHITGIARNRPLGADGSEMRVLLPEFFGGAQCLRHFL